MLRCLSFPCDKNDGLHIFYTVRSTHADYIHSTKIPIPTITCEKVRHYQICRLLCSVQYKNCKINPTNVDIRSGGKTQYEALWGRIKESEWKLNVMP